MALPTPRQLAVLLSLALLLAAAVGAASASTQTARDATRSSARLLVADATAAPRASTVARAVADYRGGPITTSTGETVDVRVSDALPPETATPEAWAEFFTGLTHGPELSQLTAYILTLDEMQEICGTQALGCYARNQLFAPGEPAFDTSPEEVVRHEYGHHIAFHRLNSPWAAIDWGPKRWASAVNVCSRVSRDEAFPGDQGSNYARNPGEAWAEVYRLMDERKVGITTANWSIIAPSFYPNDPALAAADLDVVQPWTALRTTSFSRTFAKKATKVWWIPLTTPLDGDYRISATVPGRGSAEIALVRSDRKTVIRRAQWVSQRVKRATGPICGQRSLFLRVTPKALVGRVRVSVTTP